MKKHGVAIDCSSCQFVASHNEKSFSVVVPVGDEASKVTGQATLHCDVSSEVHVVKLSGWQSQEAPVVAAGSDLARRLTGALEFVAEKRLCGNRSLCPTEVVELVGKANPPDDL